MNKVGQRERACQDRVVQFFQEKLGWDYLGNWEERENNACVEESYLRRFLQETQGYSSKLIDRALHQLDKEVGDQVNDLYPVNQKVYKLLRYGIKVKATEGEQKQTVWLIDWKNPLRNHFAIAEEVSVKGTHTKRPDIVLYVNGIALGVIELKRDSIPVEQGIRQNLDNQQDRFIQRFFHCMQLVMAGNDSQGLRYGTIETPEKYYLTWKEPDKKQYAHLRDSEIHQLLEETEIRLDRHLAMFCHKKRFLEIIHDFMLFDGGSKKICRPHQYFGIQASRQFIRDREGGIIWHTQGSGKSLTMVWLTQWIRENIDDSRVLIITDRDELDKQIVRVFDGVGEQMARAKSGKDLIHMLNKNEHPLLCSLVHKFGHKEEGEYKDYIEEIKKNLPRDFKAKGKVFVFVDECHRTQSGKLHEAMKVVLPEALFIGFTGTPLLKKDKKKSLEVFGRYIHTYKFDEAVKDKVVLDLQYEARDVDQKITDQAKIDEWFDNKTQGLTDVAKAELKGRWGTMKKLLSSKSRLEKIVFDILEDFSQRPRLSTGHGNAILVAGSVFEACKYYKLFQDYDFENCAIVTSYEPNINKTKGETTGAGSTEELQKYKIYQKMLRGKSTEEFETEAKYLFINEPARMQLLIVVDKLLTGFDAPACTYLYIDKKMQDHGLFQAICRVNRLHSEDKEFGYVVDYKDLFRSLEQSIDSYTSEAFDHYDKEDVAGLLKNRLDVAKNRLDDALEAVIALCEPVHPRESVHFIRFFCGDPEKSDDLKETEEKRVALYKLTAALIRSYANLANEMLAAGYTRERADKIKGEVTYYTHLRDEIKLASDEYIDLKAYEPDMRKLIDMYISAEPSRKLSAFEDLTLLELIVERGLGALESLPEGIRRDRGAVAETIENNMRRVIIEESLNNPAYYEKMSVLLQELIIQRREGALEYETYLQEVLELSKKIKQPSASAHYPQSIDTRAKQALYDNLGQDEALSMVMDAEIKYVKKDSWRGNKRKEREILLAIKKHLPEDANLDEIFDIIKEQDEY